MATTKLMARTSGWWAVGESAQQVLDNIVSVRHLSAQKSRELKRFVSRKAKGLDLSERDENGIDRVAVIEFSWIADPIESALESIHDSMPIADLNYGCMDDVRKGLDDAQAGLDRQSNENYYLKGWWAYTNLTERYGRLRPAFIVSRAA